MKYSEQLGSRAASLRKVNPLILNITNYVAMNMSANILLAAGASPIMSFYKDEMQDIVPKCGAVLINIGCLDERIEACAVEAARIARTCNIPIVLDPVGVGISQKRKDICLKLIKNFKLSIIRANASEVSCLKALICDEISAGYGQGVDSTESSANALEAAETLARECGSVVSMSGEADYITDGTRTLKVEGGSALMPQVTAMGCSASALTAAFAAIVADMLDAASCAMEMMARAGEIAATHAKSPGSFTAAFIDAIATTGKKTFQRQMLRLYLVTDRALAGDRDIVTICEEAVKAGATMVQLREKDLATDEFIAMGKRLKKALKPFGVPLIINDRVDVALACDADGVHIGQCDMPYETARRLLGPDKIIGLSVENLQQVREANLLDVDYIGVSPVLATQTKTDTAAPFGLDGLREAVALSTHPTVAIGGMNARTAADTMRTGTDGIAVVSAIMCAENTQEATKELKNILG